MMKPSEEDLKRWKEQTLIEKIVLTLMFGPLRKFYTFKKDYPWHKLPAVYKKIAKNILLIPIELVLIITLIPTMLILLGISNLALMLIRLFNWVLSIVGIDFKIYT